VIGLNYQIGLELPEIGFGLELPDWFKITRLVLNRQLSEIGLELPDWF